MLKVAIVGCGKIADDHASQIGRIKDCQIVAACDREILMARQLYERFPVGRYFDDLQQMLDQTSPDVVHITTPPQTHFELAMRSLENGCHVYVEKPFTLYADEAAKLIGFAENRQLKVTAGHDDQFSHVARRMRTLVSSGYLGGRPVHMESYYCYEFGKTAYAAALLGNKQHWVRSLPGKLLQNIISHGIARIAEFLAGDKPTIAVTGFTSPMLRSMGESEIIDELRVVIVDELSTTAYFTFSSQLRPVLHQFRIYGPCNSLILDHDQETLIKLRGKRYLSHAERFVPPVTLASQYLRNWSANLKTFLSNDFHQKSGMKYLIETFYRSIGQGTEPPIPPREILLTARIMDGIFSQLSSMPKQKQAMEPTTALSSV